MARIGAIAVFLIMAAGIGEASAAADRALQAAGNLTLLADWNQTRQIVRHPDGFHETNRILGQHPKLTTVDSYFIAWLVGLNLLSEKLPRDRANALWAGVIVIELRAIDRNYGVGLRIRF